MRSVTSWLVAVTGCVAGCGRLGFDPVAPPVIDGPPDVPVEPAISTVLAGAAGVDWARSIAATPDGGWVIVGANGSALTLWTTTLGFAGGAADGFVLKLDASGAVSWVRACASAGSEIVNEVVVAAAGDVFVGGTSDSGGTDCGGGPMSPAGRMAAWVASFAPDGTYRWARAFSPPEANPGAYYDQVRGMTLHGDQLTVTGSMHGTVDFGGGATAPVVGAWNAFLAAYDLDGGFRFARRYGGTGATIGRGVTTDDLGNIYAVGEFDGTTDFGGGAVTSQAGSDPFLIALDAAGVPRWSTTIPGTGTGDRPGGVTVLADEVVVAGAHDGTLASGGRMITTAGGTDGFAAAFATGGPPRWLVGAGGPLCDKFSDVRTFRGQALLAGYFSATAMVGSAPVTSTGGADGFIVASDAAGALGVVATYGEAGSDAITMLAPVGATRYLAVGYRNDANDPCAAGVLYVERDLYIGILPADATRQPRAP